MHAILICFLIALLLSLSTTAKPEPSDLQLISEDFRILSRVTNAISLQASAIRKDIKVGDVLSELLHVTPESFTTIVNVDTKTANFELNRIHEAYSKAAKPVVITDANDLKEGLANLYFLSWFSRQEAYLKKASEIPADDFHKSIQSITNDFVVNNDCSKLNYKNLEQFEKLFDISSRLPEDNQIAEIINTFKMNQSYGKIMGCINGLQTLEESFRDLSIFKINKDYEILIDAKRISMEFIQIEHSLKELMEKKLDTIKEDIERTKLIWEGSTKKLQTDHENIEKAMGQFQDSINTTETYITFRMYPLSTFTVGFENSEDLMKVFDDLKSSWFQKKFARGANTEHLAKELELFRNISQKILDLELAWKDFTANAEKLGLDTGLSVRVKRIKDVTNIASNYINHTKHLTESKEVLKKCLKFDTTFDPSQYGIFEREQQSAIEVFNRIEANQKRVSDLRNEIFYKLFFDQERFVFINDILNRINNMKDANTKNSLRARIEIDKYIHTHDDGVNFLDIIRKTAWLSRELNELKNASQKVEINMTVTIKSILRDMKLIEMAKCLGDENFGKLEIEKTYKTLVGLVKFPENKAFEDMNQYLLALSNVREQFAIVQKTVKNTSSKTTNTVNTVLALKNSRFISESIGLCTKVLENLEYARQNQQRLLDFKDFSGEVKEIIQNEKLLEWKRPKVTLNHMFNAAEKVNRIAGNVRNESVLEMTKVFEEAAKVHGIAGSQQSLNLLYLELHHYKFSNQNEAAKYFSFVRDFDLDFAKYHAQLKNSRVTVTSLKQYFDEIFGHTKQKTKTVTIEKYIKPPLSWIAIVCICIGLILLILIGAAVIYGFTENGRTRYKNTYLYYFGKPETFEKRWRYSCFMDKVDGKNALVDAVREVNRRNLLLALKRGAFVNAYNRHGNTALHAATKAAHPEFVELLIKYGADRTLLNAKNLTPEQMIPFKHGPDDEDKKERFEACKVIFKKYKKKTYRISVPQKFPVNSFHIWMDPDTENKLTNQFMDKFPAITTDEAIPTTTHLVAKTDENGIWVTDNLELLLWIFNGAIIVKEQWMADCVYDETLIDHDSKYLVENIKYKGTIYKSVLPWTQAMSKFTMPYLYGVFMHVVIKDYPNLFHLTSLVTHQGGIMLNSMPSKEYFNTGSHPYLHAHFGPIFLIHDGTMDLSAYKNDPDKMFTLFTEEEFIIFMLKREIHRDTSEHPIPVLKGGDD